MFCMIPKGYEYPVDDYGQIYVLLEAELADAIVIEEEREQKTKKWKYLMLVWPLLVPLLVQLI